MVRRNLAAFAAASMLVACASPGPGGVQMALTDTPLYGKFVWNDLITDDLSGAQAFYGGLFGWTFEKTERPGGGDYTLIVSGSGQYVGGMVHQADPGNGQDYSRWLGYIAVADVDEATRYTATTGGKVVVPARDIGMIARAAVVTDPEGAVVGLVNSVRGYPADIASVGAGEVAWHELLAENDGAAASWYTPLALYTVNQQQRPGGTYWLLDAAGRSRAGVMQRPNDQVQPVWLTHFRVTDLADSVARVKSLGGTVLLAPNPQVRRGALALVTDPSGALLALSDSTTERAVQ